MNRYLVSFVGVIGVGAALVVAACAGEETGTSTSSGGGEGGSSPTSGPTSTSSASSAGQGGAGQGGAGQGGAGQGGAGQGGAGQGGAGEGGAGGGGSSALAPALNIMDLYVDCMPIVGADPLHGSFTATYDNSAGSGFEEAVITKVKLVMGDMKEWTLSVAPNKSGMIGAGQTTMAAHTKVDGSVSGPASLCSYCNSTWTLDVTWDVGGQVVNDTLGPELVQCVF